MDIQDPHTLKQTAVSALSQASYNPKKLVTLHTVVALGIPALLTVISFFLSKQIDQTGGLSGMGLRSVLSTVLLLLQFASMVIMPFWEIGLTHSCIRLIRRESAEPVSLLKGFRRIGPVFRLELLQAFLYAGLGLFAMNIASMIFMMTPLSDAFLEQLEPLLSDPSVLSGTASMQELLPMEALQNAIIPCILIFMVLFAAGAIFLSYMLRMSRFLIIDDNATGAFAAVRKSARLMQNNKLAMFRLDVSFWWFYVVQILAMVLSYADTILPSLGISLPFTEDVSYFLFYGLYIGITFVLHRMARGYVMTTYAAAYESLRPSLPPSAK